MDERLTKDHIQNLRVTLTFDTLSQDARLKEVALAFVNLPEVQELSAIAFKREILSIAAKTGKAPITVQGRIEGGERGNEHA